MHTNGIDASTRQTLQTLSKLTLINSYYLAGGTACSLHFGHRVSYDLDFFSPTPVEPQQIRNQLASLGKLEIFQNDQGTFNGMFNETKLSFFIYPYKLLQPTSFFDEVRITAIEDLLCMKLEAIASRGVKRDFVDIFFMLRNSTLEKALLLYEQKYASENIATSHVLKSLVYFEDARNDPDPAMLVTYNWAEIEKFFTDMVKKYMKQ